MKRKIPEGFSEWLIYNKETGLLYWKKSPAPCMKNKLKDAAGTIDGAGYVSIHFNNKLYKGHRIAWYLQYGHWPTSKEEIDHINGIRTDNRISNMRLVNRSLNQKNRIEHRNGRLYGTAYHKRCPKNPWQGRTTVDGKAKSLGYFSTEQLAHEAVLKFLKENT